ncbi:MAG: hypothetical protein KC488_10150, partial [Candidatus Cloacimonetes bacterium]|nr:hypothetical protein [Candidatus Cloacimonadota bacterium]
MLLFALVAGLIGELWLKPSPLLTAEVLEESDVVEPFGTFDFSNDGWLDWVSHTMNPSYKASLVVNMLPDDSSRAEADFQFYFPGKHVVGQADPVQAATGILIHTTSRTDSTVWFSRLTIDKEGHSSREDTLLFDGTRADLSNIAFPAICGLPIRFPGTSRLLIPLWGNFMAWRGAVITDMQDFSHLTLVPAGVGMSLADTLAVRMPDGRQLLLAYGSGSNNGNTLGGFPDTGSWMFLVDPDSGIVRHRHMAAFKSMRATLFPDQRHVMLTGGQLYDGQEATPTLLVWDSWTDSLALAEKLPLQNPTQPVRCGDELLWFDGEHQVWVATPSQLRARKLYELPLSRFATVRSSGDSWVIWDGANMALVRCHDGRLLMRLPSSIKGGRVWLEQPPAADL